MQIYAFRMELRSGKGGPWGIFSGTSIQLQFCAKFRKPPLNPPLGCRKSGKSAGNEFLHIGKMHTKPIRQIAMLERKASVRSETFQLLANIIENLLPNDSVAASADE